MKRIIRILKSRVVIGTVIIYVVGTGLTVIFSNLGIGILFGNLLPLWWVYCFFTRNRKQKGDDYGALPGWKNK